jgi:hypothetical protein
MYGFRCQALVSLGPLSTPIKDKADRFPVQAVLHPERGVGDFGVLVRIFKSEPPRRSADADRSESGWPHMQGSLGGGEGELRRPSPPFFIESGKLQPHAQRKCWHWTMQ